MNTSFGFFTTDALANQVGLPTTDAERTRRDQDSDVFIDLNKRPDSLFGGIARIAEGRLRMIDAVTGFWPEGGDAGLGRIRGLQEIDPGTWYFKAHFYQDPVQPGSLGLEALLQLLQCAMLLGGLDEGVKNPRFEAIALDEALVWKYRGQVLPTNKQVTTELELTRVERDGRGVMAVARGSLWVDGLRIYEVENLTVRIVSQAAGSSGTISLDLETAPWLRDHCPTYTISTLPMMVMVDYLAAAAAANDPGGGIVVALEDVRVHRWVTVAEKPVHLKSTVAPDDNDGLAVSLMTGADIVATARVILADSYPAAPAPLAALENAAPAAENPYETGALIHGPAFQIMSGLTEGDGGASFTLDGTGGAVPRGCLNPGLLDGVLHGFPHDRPETLFPDIEAGQVAYPHHIQRITFHGPPPEDGVVHAQVRADRDASDGRRVVFHAQAAVGGRLWMDMTMTDILLPKGPLGMSAPQDLRAFLRDKTYVANIGLSRFDDTATRLDAATVRANNWLPGTLEGVYGVSGGTDAMTRAIAIKEHVAKRARVHPSRVTLVMGGGFCDSLPMTRFPVNVTEDQGAITVTDAGAPEPNADAIRDDWRHRLNSGPSPVEDVFLALVQRFVGRVVLEDPDALAAIKGQPTLFLGNHQTGIESLLFSIIGSAIGGRPIITIAKNEHRETWLGRLIQICQEYPGVSPPRTFMFFDRDNQRSMIDLVSEVEKALVDEGLSLMIHAEGTRALHCRQPVKRISAVFLDLAVAAGLPIVPVRFAGGLPVTAADGATRLEFPFGFGRQDIYLGRPIMPKTLAAELLGERRDRVLDALNGLGPDLMAEDPSPPDTKFATGTAYWNDEWNITGPRDAVLHTISSDPSMGPELTALVDSIRGKGELPAGTAEADWLLRLSRWFIDGT
jgi:3-hydroxymyristoyl/3-hydroxydecanoyl-(acyl carrier protein) dehydratase/1-acyl-sn-glycerol-3-phosphate acyltransferase